MPEVYVVIISSHVLHTSMVLGAVYLSEDEAMDECERYNKASRYTNASYAIREVQRPPINAISPQAEAEVAFAKALRDCK